MRILVVLLNCAASLAAQAPNLKVDFSDKRQTWDGFGVNYVEVPQTRDYKANPQEYSGLNALSEEKRAKLLDEIFGPEGLKPGVFKMFSTSLGMRWQRGASASGHEI